MEPELHLFVIWEKARRVERRIMEDLRREMEVVHSYELRFEDGAADGYKRFYGSRLPSVGKKVKKCGAGPFRVVIVRDRNPSYETFCTSQRLHRMFTGNHTLHVLKERYRAWAGGHHRVHATLTRDEFAHDVYLLSGHTAAEWEAGVPSGELALHLDAPASAYGGKRRIGLLTIFRCTNYGAVLQAIALRRLLMRLAPDADVEVINHWMDSRDTHLLGKITNPNTPCFQRWLNRRKFARRYLGSDLFEARRAKTVSLIARELMPTACVCRSPEDFRSVPGYDVIVVGSDQVWNPALNHDFPTNPYLCAEIPARQRRVAYAASFGVGELPSACEAVYRSALERFAALTVREETGAAICERLLNRRPEVVLDPTMLLTADEWISVVDSPPQPSSGLLAYWVRRVEQADVDALAALARVRGERVRLLSAGPLPKLALPPEVEVCIDAGPFDFVRLVAASSGVVTDSFHGLQFAVCFGKPVLALGHLADAKSNASRLVDFCRLIGLPAACEELSAFRAGGARTLAETAACDRSALDAARERSLAALKSMVATAATG